MKTQLKRTFDTWGSYGQHNGSQDFVLLDGVFVAAEDLPEAEVVDQSADSRKNRHTLIETTADLPVGTIGRTESDYASSSRSCLSREYWRIGESGEREEVAHTPTRKIEGQVKETWDRLATGEEVLFSRVPEGVRLNSYPGKCACCRRDVPKERGEIFKSGGKWFVRCVDCFVNQGR